MEEAESEQKGWSHNRVGGVRAEWAVSELWGQSQSRGGKTRSPPLNKQEVFYSRQEVPPPNRMCPTLLCISWNRRS